MNRLVSDFENGVGNCAQYVSSFVNKHEFFGSNTKVLHFLPYDSFYRGGGHTVILKDGVIYDVYDRVIHSKNSTEFLQGSKGFSTYSYFLANRDKLEIGVVDPKELNLSPMFNFFNVFDGHLITKYVFNIIKVYTFSNTHMVVSKLPYEGLKLAMHYLAIVNIVGFWLFNISFFLKRVFYVRHIRRKYTT
jgi:hypothetical protein